MYSISTVLFLLSTLALHTNGVSLGLPGKKLPLAKRTHRIPRTLQEPSFYKREAKDISPLEKKGTLETRQETCSAGTTSCPTGGCCDGPCCGDGCCPAGYNCRFVGSTPGCCPVATTCSNQISGCTDAGYVECSGFDFCCPAGQVCSLDAGGNAQCNGVSIGNGNANTAPAASGSSDPASPPSSPTTTPNAGGGNTSINLGGAATTTPFNTLPATTTPFNTLPVTTANVVATTKGNPGSAPPLNSASTRTSGGRIGVGAMAFALLGGLMGI